MVLKYSNNGCIAKRVGHEARTTGNSLFIDYSGPI